MKYTYRVYTYDVWGNEEDGYEVNDVFRTSETVELDSKGTIQQDIEELIEQGILRSSINREEIEFEGDEDTIYITYRGVPTAELRKERTMRNPQRLIGRHNLYKEYIQQYKNNLRQLSRLFKDIREDNLLSRNQKDELIGTISDLQRQLQFYK